MSQIKIKTIIALPLFFLLASDKVLTNPMLDSAGKFVVRVAVSAGAIGAGAVSVANKYPQAVDRLIAFKNAGAAVQATTTTQPQIVIQQSAPSATGLESLVSYLPYITKKNIAVSGLVISTGAVIYKYVNDKRFKNWIDDKITTAKEETIQKIDTFKNEITPIISTTKAKVLEISDGLTTLKRYIQQRFTSSEEANERRHQETTTTLNANGDAIAELKTEIETMRNENTANHETTHDLLRTLSDNRLSNQ